ncbi:MAG: twin-arginine translocase TatA/TatE family subunit [Acidimicrobiales bacterium]
MLLAEIIGPDILIVLAVIALLFGSTRLPKLARSLGSASSEFRKGMEHGADDGDNNTDTSPPGADSTATETDSTATGADSTSSLPREVGTPPPLRAPHAEPEPAPPGSEPAHPGSEHTGP